MEDFTDYHIKHFFTVRYNPGYLHSSLHHLPWLTPFTIIFYFVSRHFAYRQHLLLPREIHFLLFTYTLIFLLTINTIWYFIRASLGHKIITSTISKSGLTINHHQHDWKDFAIPSCQKNLQHASHSSSLILTLPTTKGQLHLAFQDQTQKKTALRTIRHYLDNFP